IPIYQRTYSWTRGECEQLWADIVRAATNDDVKDHFIGSIVYVQQGILVIARTPQFLVIDGQQRLTTLSLLLMALARAAQAAGGAATGAAPEVTHEEINDTYLATSTAATKSGTSCSSPEPTRRRSLRWWRARNCRSGRRSGSPTITTTSRTRSSGRA